MLHAGGHNPQALSFTTFSPIIQLLSKKNGVKLVKNGAQKNVSLPLCSYISFEVVNRSSILKRKNGRQVHVEIQKAIRAIY